jgi:hypothetical protein
MDIGPGSERTCLAHTRWWLFLVPFSDAITCCLSVCHDAPTIGYLALEVRGELQVCTVLFICCDCHRDLNESFLRQRTLSHGK